MLYKWTHIAYTWDGKTRMFCEQLDGKTTMRQPPWSPMGQTFDLNVGTVYVGTSADDGPGECKSFVGLIDEVQLYSHARSGRTICLSTHGADCIHQAIQDKPTDGQFVLGHQQPDCNGPYAINSTECWTAIHCVFSQEGTVHALTSARNVLNTIRQILGSRPPVSLGGFISQLVGDCVSDINSTSIAFNAGVGVSSFDKARVACAPMPQEAVAISFAELESFHRRCYNDAMAPTLPCLSASSSFCKSIGWTTGYIFEVTTRAWMLCFEADFIGEFEEALSSGCNQGQWEDVNCGLAVTAWCQDKGYHAGLIQEVRDTSVPTVHCFHGSMVQDYPFT